MKRNILIVEDDVFIAENVKLILGSFEGYETASIAYDMEDALKLLDEQSFDLALLDIDLGDGPSGIEIAKELQSLGIPFIYTTSFSSKELVDKALDMNPYGYLVKPIERANLFTALQLAFHKIPKNKLNIKNGKTILKLELDAITHIKAEGNYIDIFTVDKKYTFKKSLKSIEDRLTENFIKINRNTIIHKVHVLKAGNTVVMKSGVSFKLSRNYRDAFNLLK